MSCWGPGVSRLREVGAERISMQEVREDQEFMRVNRRDFINSYEVLTAKVDAEIYRLLLEAPNKAGEVICE